MEPIAQPRTMEAAKWPAISGVWEVHVGVLLAFHCLCLRPLQGRADIGYRTSTIVEVKAFLQ